MNNVDQENVKLPVAKQMEKCLKNSEIWGENAVLANSVFEALTLIKEDGDIELVQNEERKPQVLVTGSLHLVGALLSIIDPEFSMSTKF